MKDDDDCNLASMNSLNTHDSNDMQSHKLGDAMFDEDDMFSRLSFDEAGSSCAAEPAPLSQAFNPVYNWLVTNVYYTTFFL